VEDILLASGNYVASASIVPGAAHRLWCAVAGGAVLNYGLEFAGSGVPEIHGLRFNLPDVAHAADYGGYKAAVLMRGSIGGWNVSDCYFDGANLVHGGIYAVI